MTTAWGWIKGFGSFWYGFIIGDDWVAAAGVVVALLGTYGLRSAGLIAWWFGPLVILVTAALTVRRALRRRASTAS